MNHAPPRKRFGQHFLHDPAVLGRLVELIGPEPGDHFVEIGPGRGALTRPLLDRIAQLDAIEVDRDLAARLRSEIPDERLVIHQADALKFDFASLDGELRLAGNLPYNISTPLMFHLLSSGKRFCDLHLMLQKEVVDRMTAEPGGRTYGRLTVALAARCRLKRLMVIKAGAFTPPPKVDSAFVRLVPDDERQGKILSEASLDRILRQAFSMRRKRLSNALGALLSSDELESLSVDPGCRPETLDADSFVRIANYFAEREAQGDDTLE